jgi:hypothetical protein
VKSRQTLFSARLQTFFKHGCKTTDSMRFSSQDKTCGSTDWWPVSGVPESPGLLAGLDRHHEADLIPEQGVRNAHSSVPIQKPPHKRSPPAQRHCLSSRNSVHDRSTCVTKLWRGRAVRQPNGHMDRMATSPHLASFNRLKRRPDPGSRAARVPRIHEAPLRTHRSGACGSTRNRGYTTLARVPLLSHAREAICYRPDRVSRPALVAARYLGYPIPWQAQRVPS